jgi:hypothetical protein
VILALLVLTPGRTPSGNESAFNHPIVPNKIRAVRPNPVDKHRLLINRTHPKLLVAKDTADSIIEKVIPTFVPRLEVWNAFYAIA